MDYRISETSITPELIQNSNLTIFQYSAYTPGGAPSSIPVLRLNSIYAFTGVVRHWGQVTGTIWHPSTLALTVDIRSLVFWYRYFTAQDLQCLCNAHHISFGTKKKDKMIRELLDHHCSVDCQSILYVFTCMNRARRDVYEQFAVARVQQQDTERAQAVRKEMKVPIMAVEQGVMSTDDAFQPLDKELKRDIIDEWQRKMNTENLKLQVCAVCSRRVRETDSSWVDCGTIDLSLLRNDALPIECRPVSYSFELYQRALLNPKGMESTEQLGKLRVCVQCAKALSTGTMPKFSLANFLYYGRDTLPDSARDAFEKSSIFDRMMICRAKANNVVCRFNYKTGDSAEANKADVLANARKGIRGNVVVAPLDVIKLNNVIPPGPDAVRDTMCAVFVSTIMPSMETISKFSPILVRRSRIRTLIEFLLRYNEHYRPGPDFGFSEANCQRLLMRGHDEGIPPTVEIVQVRPNDAVEVGTSDYTPRNVDEGGSSQEEFVMENVSYTEGDDSPISYREMKSKALQHCLQRKPLIVTATGSHLVPDFNNPSLLTWLFPHLDPWGIGGFYHPRRLHKLSLEEQVRYLLTIDDSPFERDPQFAFVFYSIIRKQTVSNRLRFTISYKAHEAVFQSLLEVDLEILARLNEACKIDPSYRPSTADEDKAFKLLSSLRMLSRHVPGSDGYKVLQRNKIRAIIHRRGTPNLFVTLNPADVDHPIVRLLSGEEIDLEDLNRGEDMEDWSRRLFAAKHPAACALFFDLMIRNFISIILRYGRADRGAYGRCIAYYGTVEAQGKGTLHCHMLIWLDGHLSPQHLRDRLAKNNDFKKKVFGWLESVIQCEFPEDMSVEQATSSHTTRVRHKDFGNPHPGTIPAPRLSLYSTREEEFWKQFGFFTQQLLYEYNWHVHTATCWKYLKRGEGKSDDTCRLGMNGQTRNETILEPDTNAILLRRRHPLVSAYTDVTTFLLQCNMNIQFVGSGDAAKAFIYYVTDYITKPNLPVHVGMAALYHVAKRTQANMDESQREKQTTSAVTSAVNAMMAHQEISHPQVMSFLVGGGDYYTSEEFAILNWGALKREVEQRLRSDVQVPHQAMNNPQSEITAEVHIHEDEITASTQYLDYSLRGRDAGLEAMCLYDFIASVTKRKMPHPVSHGRFLNARHPQHNTHYLSMRMQSLTPVLLGPSIPNPNRSDESREDWAYNMILLFKPWRNPVDLKPTDMTWWDAFDIFQVNISDGQKQIIKNMTVLTECGDAREYYTARGRRENAPETGKPKSHMPYHDIPEQYLNEALAAIELIDRDLGRNREDVVDEALNNALGVENVRLLNLCLPALEVGHQKQSDGNRFVQVTEADRAEISRFGEIMSAKRKRQVAGETEGELEMNHPTQRRRTEVPTVEIRALSERQDRQLFQRYALRVALDIAEQMKLNKEQKRAFDLVAIQLIQQPWPQLLMHVAGVGGTGKSHVIKAIVLLFQRLNKRSSLLLGAPTGIAAVIIGGQTLHSLILHSVNGNGPNHAELARVWDKVQFLIVDEVSMVGASFMSLLSLRMRQGKGNNVYARDKPFGGVNVVFMGDFGQLDPPKQASLYSYRLVQNPSFQESTKKGMEAMNGAALWRQVSHVVELKKNERQSSDPIYAAFLNRLRLGTCRGKQNATDIDDYEYISRRLLSNLAYSKTGHHNLADFQDAPVIVGTKAIRDVINARLVLHHATKRQAEVFDYYSHDTIRRAAPGIEVQKLLWEIPSTKTSDAFGRLSMFIGMRVMITENLAFGDGVVNGREGVIVDIKYEVEANRRYALAALVLIEGCGMSIPGLPQDVVPILPSPTPVKCDHLQHPDLNAQTFTRRQLPLVPAYAFTDYKSQGRTMPRAIVDLATARGQGIYVMLSRVRSLDGVAILRWFPPSKIFSRLSQELRNEMDRLQLLERKTADQWSETEGDEGIIALLSLLSVDDEEGASEPLEGEDDTRMNSMSVEES